MKPVQQSLSVVLPAKNEALSLPALIGEIHQALEGQFDYEVVVVDDGSDDGTGQAAIDAAAPLGCPLQVIRHRHSCGQSTAILSGVRAAHGTWIATLDADGQNDPADIPAMVNLASQDPIHHICIAGFRENRLDSEWKRFQSRVANRLRASLLNDGVPDTGCGLKVLRRETFLSLPYFDHMHRFLPALIIRMGGTVRVHPVHHRPRLAGQSKYGAFNRAWVGLVDLFGVLWLQRRAKRPEIETLQ